MLDLHTKCRNMRKFTHWAFQYWEFFKITRLGYQNFEDVLMTVSDKLDVDDDRMTLVAVPDSLIVSILQDIIVVWGDISHQI